ncbi:MAG: neutral/alkaline non-lysosomal ceramidase N-terminal domain-containing protein, partial [Fimbriimonadales bacterium]
PEALARLALARFAPSKAELTLLRLGRALIVGVPGEPTSAVGRSLQEAARRKGFDPVVVASHVGGWIGYLLTPDEYREGGYEATLAFHGPDLSRRLQEALDRGLQRMSQIR